jgi:hypothetical protein
MINQAKLSKQFCIEFIIDMHFMKLTMMLNLFLDILRLDILYLPDMLLILTIQDNIL